MSRVLFSNSISPPNTLFHLPCLSFMPYSHPPCWCRSVANRPIQTVLDFLILVVDRVSPWPRLLCPHKMSTASQLLNKDAAWATVPSPTCQSSVTPDRLLRVCLLLCHSQETHCKPRRRKQPGRVYDVCPTLYTDISPWLPNTTLVSAWPLYCYYYSDWLILM